MVDDRLAGAPGGLSKFNRVKRVGDVVLVCVTSPLSSVALSVIGLAIRLLDGPPVLYRQEREGLDGRPFQVLKFRTMSQARDETGQLLPDAQRLTRVGRVLRRFSLDELPQLLNVLKGEMSLVGPRPLYTRYSAYYSNRERLRQRVRPGITGLAQTSGRNAVGWTERFALDVEYVGRHTVRLDLVILARTVLKAVRSEGVLVVAGDGGDPLDVERSYPSSDSIALRRLYPRDLEARVRWLNDDGTRHHMSVVGEVSAASTARWHERTRADERRRDFVAYDRRTGRALAMAGLTGLEGGRAEFYVFVDPLFSGRGIGSVTTGLVITWAERSHFAEHIWLTVDTSNVPAVRIYRRCGFRVSSETADGRLLMTRAIGTD